MKQTPVKIFLIILLLNAILVVFSVFLNNINTAFFSNISYALKFPQFNIFSSEKKSVDETNFALVTPEDSLKAVSSGKLHWLLPVDSSRLLELVNKFAKTRLSGDSINNKKIITEFFASYQNYDTSKIQRFIRKTLLAALEKSGDKNIFNPENKGVSPMDNFYDALLHQCDTSLIRIAHYGDSQLEGDRITFNLRRKFQQKFGGSGTGFVPFIESVSNMGLSHFQTDNWHRYTVFFDRSCNNFYGISGQIFRFLPCEWMKQPDSIKTDTSSAKRLKQNTQSIGLILANWISYQKASIMYGRSRTNCFVNIYNTENTLIQKDTLPATSGFAIKELHVPLSMKKFRFEFICDGSPDFYGFLFDGKKGVQADNYSLRGHSGDGLMIINTKFMAEQATALNTKLLILQYGANAVPYIKGEKNCKFLEESFYQILMKCKTIAPKASILLLGVGDMATRIEGKYKSYPMLPKIREAQKNAAIRANCAYWETSAAMGGENAILKWTNEGLASFDGHLSPSGQEIMAKSLFEAIMREYDKYLATHTGNLSVKGN